MAIELRESMQTVFKVRVQIAPVTCFKCAQRIKTVRGYLYGKAFVALNNVSDRRQLAALIADLRQHDTAITPVGYDGQRLAARCPGCSMICSNLFLTAEFFKKSVQCQFPSCGCDYPNLQCRKFEYHSISLRLGRNELQFIDHQNGWI